MEAMFARARNVMEGRGVPLGGNWPDATDMVDLAKLTLAAAGAGRGTSMTAVLYRLLGMRLFGFRFPLATVAGYYATYTCTQAVRVSGGRPVFPNLWARAGADGGAYGRLLDPRGFMENSTYDAEVPEWLKETWVAGSLWVLGVALRPLGGRVRWHSGTFIPAAQLIPPPAAQLAATCRWLLDALKAYCEESEAVGAVSAMVETVGMRVGVEVAYPEENEVSEADEGFHVTAMRRTTRETAAVDAPGDLGRGCGGTLGGVLLGIDKGWAITLANNAAGVPAVWTIANFFLARAAGQAWTNGSSVKASVQHIWDLDSVGIQAYGVQPNGQRLPYREDFRIATRSIVDPIYVAGPNSSALWLRLCTAYSHPPARCPTSTHPTNFNALVTLAHFHVSLTMSRNGLDFFDSVYNVSAWGRNTEREERRRREVGWQRAVAANVGGDVWYFQEGEAPAKYRMAIGQCTEPVEANPAINPFCPASYIHLGVVQNVCGWRGLVVPALDSCLHEAHMVQTPALGAVAANELGVYRLEGTPALNTQYLGQFGRHIIRDGAQLLQPILLAGTVACGDTYSVAVVPQWLRMENQGFVFTGVQWPHADISVNNGSVRWRGVDEMGVRLLRDVVTTNRGWDIFRG